MLSASDRGDGCHWLSHLTALHTPGSGPVLRECLDVNEGTRPSAPLFPPSPLLQVAPGSSPTSWLSSCQVLFSDFPGRDPISPLLPRAPPAYPLCPIHLGRTRENEQARGSPAPELPQATASPSHTATTQGPAAPAVPSRTCHHEIPAKASRAGSTQVTERGAAPSCNHASGVPVWAPHQEAVRVHATVHGSVLVFLRTHVCACEHCGHV